MESNQEGTLTPNGGTQAPAAALGEPPRSLAIAQKGVRTGKDFASLMSALMSDLIEGRVTPNVGNATCNAGGKLLKVVEMEYKYGTKGPGSGKRTLLLAVDDGEAETPSA
jgi:hypothetical protein